MIKNKLKRNCTFLRLTPLYAALAGISLVSSPSFAFELDLGGGIGGALDVTTSYSVGWRTEDQDSGITSQPNNDDGDRSFGNKGQAITNLYKVVYDLSLKKSVGKDSLVGIFNRGTAFYDERIKDASNEHDSPNTLNGNAAFGGSLTDLQSFTEATQDRAGADAKFLDAYFFLNGRQTSANAYSIRVGAQVINWGESLFIQSGISNAINPADVTQANLPGTEVKEILLPQQGVFGSLSVSDNVNLEAYYQWQWEHTIAPPVGTFLSSNDLIADDGGEVAFVGPGVFFTRGEDIDPDDGGQYGVALRWYSEALNDTDFGFYFINYHSKLPSLAINGVPNSVGAIGAGPGDNTYQLRYFDDIQLYGLSFNTVFFDTAFSGEIAYHKDFPLQTTALGSAAVGAAVAALPDNFDFSTREDLVIVQLTVNKSLNRTPFLGGLADDVGLLMEVGVVNTPGLDDGEVFRAATPVDSTAWGYRSQLTLTYFNQIGEWFPTISGTDLIVTLNFDHDVEGDSAIPAGSFSDNAKSAAIGFKASWQSELEAEIRFNAFLGDGGDDLTFLNDRDNVTLNLKYRF